MPAINLTDSAIRRLKAGTYTDKGLSVHGATLQLRVSPQGRKVFDLLYRDSAGKRCRVGSTNFGPNKGEWHGEDFTIAAARRTAREAWKQICGGRDFVAERREKEAVQTVSEAAEEYFASLLEAGGKTESITNRIASMRRDLTPALAAMKVTDVTPADIDACLKAVRERALTKPQAKTGGDRAVSSCRERLVTLFNRAGVSPNPASAPREHATKKMRIAKRSKDTITPYTPQELEARVKAVLNELAAGWIPQDSADMILMLTMISQRSAEVIHAKWSQIDLDRALWIIPPEQPGNKGAREHREPLTKAVMAMLRRRHAGRNPKCDLIFPSPAKDCEPYSRRVVYTYVTQYARPNDGKAIADRHGITLTVHDLRRLAPSWCDMTPQYFWAAPYLINHASGQRNSVDRRYARGDMTEVLRDVRQAFEDWTFGLIAPESEKVVSIDSRRQSA